MKTFEKLKASAGLAILTVSAGGSLFYLIDKPFESFAQIICALPGMLIGLKWG